MNGGCLAYILNFPQIQAQSPRDLFKYESWIILIYYPTYYTNPYKTQNPWISRQKLVHHIHLTLSIHLYAQNQPCPLAQKDSISTSCET